MEHKLTGKAAREQMRNLPEEEPVFQIAPMIDILLVLLVFFMSISSTMVLRNNREIPLAVAKDAKQAKESPGQVVVNVSWNATVETANTGLIEIDEKKYTSPAAIIPRLQQAVMANPMTRVLLRVDKATPWSYAREVDKAVGDSGITNLTFSVLDKEVH